MDFENFDLAEIATYLSLIIAIIFFIYQEFSKARNKTKETLRLKDEFINMIIRNHINSNLEIAQVDFDIVISGFEKLKSCKLIYSKKDFLEMIYAKVSDNEHIESRIRINILKQTKAVLTDVSLEENENKVNSSKFYMLFATFGASSISLILMIIASGLVIKEDILPDNPLMIVTIISIFTIIFLKAQPILDKILELLFFDKEDKKFESGESDNIESVEKLFKENIENEIEHITESGRDKKEDIPKGAKNNTDKKPHKDDVSMISINDYMKDGTKLLRISELRMMLDYKMAEYFNCYFESKKVEKIKPTSFIKTLSMLDSEKVFAENEVSAFKRLYTYANRIMQSGKNQNSNKDFDEFIEILEGSILFLDQKIETIKKIDA
ncbi:hypothetical protein M9R32_07975 [Paenisporosarcina quisquiliarum]|uniref:Uncharacterized protein n=1 Tax=Paenisporosarcina quisquiliarum TaxID=365346 RepID=A0A9X3LFN1_9BACL|nr:hypothetical protein [Paenisporosarcina quisquiliarum]MCZ8537112.1 hypothetical protein [Paenisporosarcina quisquiliarum]